MTDHRRLEQVCHRGNELLADSEAADTPLERSVSRSSLCLEGPDGCVG